MDMKDEFEHLPGLEFLRRLIADWHGSPMAETLAMRLIEVSDGSATFDP